MSLRACLARAAPMAVLTFFSEHGWQAERGDPELAALAGRVIQVLVLLLLDLFVGVPECPCFTPLSALLATWLRSQLR
jgi:hypothetical protein